MERIAYRIYDAERKVFHHSGSTPSMLEAFFRRTAVLNTLHKSEYQQFTGLEDCNGKDIYESDFVNIHCDCDSEYGCNHQPITCSVVWDEEDARFCLKRLDNQKELYACDFSGYMSDSYKIIGNIHERPDLVAE